LLFFNQEWYIGLYADCFVEDFLCTFVDVCAEKTPKINNDEMQETLNFLKNVQHKLLLFP